MKTIMTVLLLAAVGTLVADATTINWTNTLGGNWNVAANWSPNQVPGSSDSAFITNNGTYTVTLNASATVANLTIGGTSGTQSFVQNANTLTLNGASTVGSNGAFSLGGGTLGGAGSFTVNGPFNWSSGTVNNTGGVTLNGTSSLSGAGSGSMGFSGLLINAGTLTWSGGANNLYMEGGTLTNLAAGTVNITADVSAVNAGGGTIGNAGLLKKTTTTGTTTIGNGVAFINTGDVQVQSGTLDFVGGGSASGTFEVSANATLQFGNTYTLSSVSSVTGAGSAVFSGGTINASGTYDVTGTNTFSGGTVSFSGSYTITGQPVTLSGGTVNFNAGGTVALTGLTISGGILGGTLPLTVNGPFNWSSGTVNNMGGVTLNGTSSLSGAGSGSMGFSGLLINAGTLTWSGGANNLYMEGGTLTNLAAGTVNITADVSAVNAGGGTIGNAGLLKKTTTTGTTTIGNGVAFINTGDVQVQSGTLDFVGGGSASGTFEVSANATLQFGNTYTLSSVSSVTGAGSAVFSGGTINASGTYDVTGTNTFSGGTVSFSGSYTITGQPVTLSGGTVNFNAGGTVALTGLTISGGILGGTLPLTVNGPFNWSSGTVNNMGGVTLNGTSSLSGAGSGSMGFSGLLINAGTLTWSGGANNLYMEGGTLTNLAAGTVNITADVSAVNAGGGTIGNAGLLKKTTTTGTTTIGNGVAFINAGILDAQSGTISLAGTYSLTNGTLNFGISGVTNFGKISLSGAAVLTGTLSANLNGGYIPNSTNSFAVLSYGSKTGVFTSTNLPLADAWQVNYGSTVTTLQVLNSRPILTPAAKQTVNELTLLTATNTATDIDTPAQTLTFALVSAPGGMNINSSSGVITWTPSQTQSPSTNIVVVSVTDNGTPPLSATNSFTVIVKEVNVSPVLPVVAQTNVNELTLLTVTNTASESNIHSTITGYGLVNPPAGMSINVSGIITWTPSQTESPSTNTITTVVTNSNPYDMVNPSLTSTNSFTVIVKEVNVAPVLPVVSMQTVNALTLLTVTNTAMETDIHAIVGYRLTAPAGAAINARGIITWTPARAQGPSTNVFTTIATNADVYDSNNPYLNATNNFTVIVYAPTLSPIGNFIVNPGQTISFTATATDNDPTRILTFNLVGPPTGATINGASGLFNWRVPVSFGNTTNAVQVNVTDNSTPSLSDSKSFTVTVSPLAPIVLTPISYTNGQFRFQVSGTTGPDYVISASGTLTSWTDIVTNFSPATPFQFTDTNTSSSNRFYRARAQ